MYRRLDEEINYSLDKSEIDRPDIKNVKNCDKEKLLLTINVMQNI